MKIDNIAFTAAAGIDIDTAKTSKQFTDWVASVDETRFTVSAVHFQSVDMFGKKVGFIKFEATVTDDAGKPIPAIVFMRGGSVGMLLVLTCQGKRYTVLTVQPRIASGRYEFIEIPAGMLDGSGNFAGVAAKELQEELGLTIPISELIELSTAAGHTRGFFVSPGGTDETLRLFAWEKEVTPQWLAEMNGKCTGVLEEGERITVKVVPFDDDLLKIDDGKTIVAYALYNAFCAKKSN